MIDKDQAVICAEFMLEEDPWNLVIPYPVACALEWYDTSHSIGSVWAVANALQQWLDRDHEACMALLGPGLEDA